MIPTKSELLADLYLIGQAYSAAPMLPAGFQLIGMIQADPAVTARLLALENSVHLPFLRTLFTPDMAPWGYMAYDPATGTVYVCIRGTETELEWAEDAAAVMVPCYTMPAWAGARVHDGFQMVFGAIENSVRSLLAIAQKLNPAAWKFQGHSLGCPLAAQARTCIGAVASAVLWAPPRLGNAAYCQQWNAITRDAVAVVNPRDAVPLLPPHILGFGDLGTQLRTPPENGFMSKEAHSLSLGYAPGIAGLAG